MANLLLDRWITESVTGDIEAVKPSKVGFVNTVKAVETLRYHITRKSKIAVHCDVDMDGIGCGYIMQKFLQSQGISNALFLINKEKVHGVQQKHVDYINKNKIDLLIILDSSTNDIEALSGFNCDVLVIDHHEFSHNMTSIDGEYTKLIVNNMLSNKNVEEINLWLKKNNENAEEIPEEYIAESRMSGALVLYELLRIYCEAYKLGNLLENLMLHQWVGITLFSDAVSMLNGRNQWYISKTVCSPDVEVGLKLILNELNKYKSRLDKSYINYTFTPVINKAIRAGASGEALDIIINKPSRIGELVKYKENQEQALSILPKGVIYTGDYVTMNITGKGVSRNYCGVIAAHLTGSGSRNAAVYIIEDGLASGSFRGRYSNVDYREYFNSYGDNIFAQGHAQAFGFKLQEETLREVMKSLSSIETKCTEREYLTAGKVEESMQGAYHINSLENFKKLGYYLRLAIGNSRVASSEEIEIVTSINEVKFVEARGKLFMYNVFGIDCKAFEALNTNLVTVYLEYNGNTVDAYARNYK